MSSVQNYGSFYWHSKFCAWQSSSLVLFLLPLSRFSYGASSNTLASRTTYKVTIYQFSLQSDCSWIPHWSPQYLACVSDSSPTKISKLTLAKLNSSFYFLNQAARNMGGHPRLPTFPNLSHPNGVNSILFPSPVSIDDFLSPKLLQIPNLIISHCSQFS